MSVVNWVLGFSWLNARSNLRCHLLSFASVSKINLSTSVFVGDIALFTLISNKQYTNDIMYIL